MSDHLLMASAKITSPSWLPGVGLLAKDVSAEVDDDFNPIAVKVGQLVGPEPLLTAAFDQFEKGGLLVAVESTAPNGRVLSGVVRRMPVRGASVSAGKTEVVQDCQLEFEPATATKPRRKVKENQRGRA